MIGWIHGKLIDKQPPNLLVDVQGIGYELEAPMSTFYELPECGANVTLYTHFAVREDAHILYAFALHAERALFRALLKVNGVGGKLALTILSGMDVEGFKVCIANGDTSSLVRLPGVGRKTAERLVIELRDRIESIGLKSEKGVLAGQKDDNHGARSAPEEAIAALISLGYKPPDAQKMVRAIQTTDATSEELIRLALRKSLRQT